MCEIVSLMRLECSQSARDLKAFDGATFSSLTLGLISNNQTSKEGNLSLSRHRAWDLLCAGVDGKLCHVRDWQER